jgi:outer membrane protein TolC
LLRYTVNLRGKQKMLLLAANIVEEYLMNRLFRRLLPIAFFLLLGFVTFAHAQASPEGAAQDESPLRLTPNLAAQMAIRNNLNLEMARVNLDMQRRAANLVWNRFVPTVGVRGTMARTNWPAPAIPPALLPPGMPPGAIPDAPAWSLLAALTADLTLSMALIGGVELVRNEYLAGLITFERASLQMEQGIRQMYNNILLMQANVALLRESYLNTQRQADMAEASFLAGLVPRLMWLQAQVAVENMRPALRDLEDGMRVLKGNFALLLGLPHDIPLELEPVSFETSVIPWDMSEMISRATASKPEILELRANIITMQSQRRAVSLQHRTPFINFNWSLQSAFAADPMNESWFDRGNWTTEGQAGGVFAITLGMSFNGLLPFTTEGQQIRNIDSGLQIQNINLAQTIRQTELEIFNIVNSLERIRVNMEVQQATVYLAEESFRLTEEAFRAGLQDFQAVQNASLALDQARLRVITEQFNYLNYLITLEYSLGIPFGTLSGNGSM